MKEEKKNRSHPIPKEQQIPQTPGTQLCMTYFYLEGRSLNSITKILNTRTKRELKEAGVDLKEIKPMEGRAVERRVHRLFKGFVNNHNKRYERLPLFDKLPNRTGRPLHKNEKQCLTIAKREKRSIEMISRLTGRDEKELREFLRKRKTLFD